MRLRQPVSSASSTTWHSSITIRSSRPTARCRFKKLANPSLTADSGVTSTTDAHSAGFSLLHSAHSIPASLQRRTMSCRSDISGTTTTVTPFEQRAGSINNRLLPPPVPITTTIGLCWRMIACSAASCTPLKLAVGPTMLFSCALTSILAICFHRRSCIALASLRIPSISSLTVLVLLCTATV